MKNYDIIIALIVRAKAEMDSHTAKKTEHPYWYSGHKNKAKRAIVTARELLLEAEKEMGAD